MWRGIFYRWNARQARLCTKEAVCSFKDVSLSDKVPPLSREALRLLDQPFLLDEGKQCRVYESSDKKYVINFSKNHRKRSPLSPAGQCARAVLARLVLPEETATIALSVKVRTFKCQQLLFLIARARLRKFRLKILRLFCSESFAVQRNSFDARSEKKTTQAATYLQSLLLCLHIAVRKGS